MQEQVGEVPESEVRIAAGPLLRDGRRHLPEPVPSQSGYLSVSFNLAVLLTSNSVLFVF